MTLRETTCSSVGGGPASDVQEDLGDLTGPHGGGGGGTVGDHGRDGGDTVGDHGRRSSGMVS